MPSAALRGLQSNVESVSGPSGTIRSLGGRPPSHILGETFYIQTPIPYGPYVAKVLLAPVSPEPLALSDAEPQWRPDLGAVAGGSPAGLTGRRQNE